MRAFLNRKRPFRSLLIGIPYLWYLLFFMVPFIIVLRISFSDIQLAIPPYTALFTWVEDSLNIALNFGNYLFLTNDPLYYQAYLSSVEIAFCATALCLIIGYPMAYGMSRAPKRLQTTLLLLILLSSWTSSLIRIYACMGILKNNGLLNNMLISLGWIDHPLIILNTNIAVYIGIVYAYIPL